MIHFTSKKRLYRQVYPNEEQISFMYKFLPILCQRYQCAIIPVPSFRTLNRVGVFRSALLHLKKLILVVCKFRAKQHELESMQHLYREDVKTTILINQE